MNFFQKLNIIIERLWLILSYAIYSILGQQKILKPNKYLNIQYWHIATNGHVFM